MRTVGEHEKGQDAEHNCGHRFGNVHHLPAFQPEQAIEAEQSGGDR